MLQLIGNNLTDMPSYTAAFVLGTIYPKFFGHMSLQRVFICLLLLIDIGLCNIFNNSTEIRVIFLMSVIVCACMPFWQCCTSSK